MALYNAVWDAPKVRGGKRRGVGLSVYEAQTLSSGSVAITTPFRVILHVEASLNEASIDGAGLGTSTFSWTNSGNIVTVKGWMPTSATNPTLIASTQATPFSVVVYGLY